MKKMILAAVAVLSLGMGSAFAQGYAGAVPQVYGSQAFPKQEYQTGFFGRFRSSHAAVDRATDQNATHGKGG